MEISKASTFASHPIQIGCLVRLGTEWTDVRVAHVVNKDHDNVWQLRSDCEVALANGEQQEDNKNDWR